MFDFKKLIFAIASFFKVKRQGPKEEASTYKFNSELSNNPYLQSRALWNDLYGSLQTKLENSYRVIFILSLVIAFALVGFVIVASESKIEPFTTVIHGDDIITLDNASSKGISSLQPELAFYFTKKFIQDARSVSVDVDVNTQNKIAAYSFVVGTATRVLKDFYEQNEPDTLSQKETKKAEITSILRESSHSLTIRWLEETRNSNSGELINRAHYIAEISYQFQISSQNKTILKNNPFGFYITYLSWSEDQTH